MHSLLIMHSLFAGFTYHDVFGMDVGPLGSTMS